jgi:hypothetical protein
MQREMIALAVAATFLSAPTAEAASCLPSPAAVRKLQPRAWPKWTHGPKGERCWYAGKKPVLAEAAPRGKLVTRKLVMRTAAPQRKPAPEVESDHHKQSPQAWALEYRWP